VPQHGEASIVRYCTGRCCCGFANHVLCPAAGASRRLCIRDPRQAVSHRRFPSNAAKNRSACSAAGHAAVLEADSLPARPQYNGCRWRGGVLRVEKARPDFKAALQEDRQAEADAELSAAEAAADARQEEHVAPASGKPVRVMRPDRKKVSAAMPLDCSPTRLQCFRPAVHARPYTLSCTLLGARPKVVMINLYHRLAHRWSDNCWCVCRRRRWRL